MSGVNSDFLKKSLKEIVETRKPREFLETLELQIALREFGNDTKIEANYKLPHLVKKKLKICVLANAAHIDECQSEKITYIEIEALQAFNKDARLIRKWARKFDFLLASDTIFKQINKLLGNVLVKAGKHPIQISENERVAAKVAELHNTIKIKAAKTPCLGTAFGNVDSDLEHLRQNFVTALNFTVTLLKKGWSNIGTVHIKTSMGKPIRVYG